MVAYSGAPRIPLALSKQVPRASFFLPIPLERFVDTDRDALVRVMLISFYDRYWTEACNVRT